MDFGGVLLFLLLVLFGPAAALALAHRRLRRRVDALEAQLEALAHPAYAPHPPEPQPAARPTETALAADEPLRPEEPAAWIGPAYEPEHAPEPRETLGVLFERLVGGRLLIWVGGVALAVAGLFLVRYSIELGLVTPELRMAGAAVFGLLLVAAGEYARRGRLLADDPRIAQALVGAGIAVLYASAYGAHVLYGMIGAAMVSALMLAITFAALLLALRHGAPAAFMGLNGGFLTPLLVGDPDAGAVPLLAYLALLNIGIFSLAWRRGWTWLAAAAVVLSFLWGGALMFAPARDALAAGMFVIALSIAAAVARPGEGRALDLMRPAAIGLVQLAVLVARGDIGPAAWALFGALAAAGLALAWFRSEYRLFPPLAVALALLLLLARGMEGADPALAWAAAGTSLLFAGFAVPRLLAARDRIVAGVTAAAALAGPALVLRWARPELLADAGWGLLALALAAALAALAWSQRGHAEQGPPGDPPLLALAAAGALLAGLAAFDLLPHHLVASAWLALAIGIALAARRIGDAALPLIAAAAALVAAARAVLMVPDLWEVLLGALFGVPALAVDLPGAGDALWALIVPAGLLLAAWRFLPGLGRAKATTGAFAGLFLLLAAYILFKQAFGLADREDFAMRGLAERAILTQALFLAGWLLASRRLPLAWLGAERMGRLGAIVTALAAARLFWFDIVLHNPFAEAQNVGAWPLLNLGLAYLLAAFWLYAARRRSAPGKSEPWLLLALAALAMGAAVLVRQLFQGPWLHGPGVPLAEFYGYSLAGLIVSAGLLGAGIRLPDKGLRLAGLLFLTATILKVFLLDAAVLEGLLRILSLMVLGAALIGIGRLYGTVLRAEAAPNGRSRVMDSKEQGA